MKFKSSLIPITLFLLSISQAAHAVPVTIEDNYYGGTPTHAAYLNKDIVGTVSTFDIKNMTVDVSSGVLSIRVNSSYFDNVGLAKTEFGDLFISSNGWSPFGSGPYNDDDHTTGEKWEYAIKLDNHGEAYSGNDAGASMIGTSGDAALYEIKDDSEIELSANARPHRVGQELQFHESATNSALANGNWSIGVLNNGYSDLLITMSLLGTPLEFVQDFGFHFTFSCGNDVIEGLYTREVPEPASMALLGAGLLGLGRLRRRKVSA